MANLKPSQIVIMASGAVMFLFSFFEQAEDGGNAWKDFGLSTFPALFGLLAAGVLAATLFLNVAIPDRILTLRINQWTLILGFTAVLILIGFWRFADKSETDLTFAFWLYLLGAIGLVAGAVMDITGAGGSEPTAAPGSSEPTPF